MNTRILSCNYVLFRKNTKQYNVRYFWSISVFLLKTDREHKRRQKYVYSKFQKKIVAKMHEQRTWNSEKRNAKNWSHLTLNTFFHLARCLSFIWWVELSRTFVSLNIIICIISCWICCISFTWNDPHSLSHHDQMHGPMSA